MELSRNITVIPARKRVGNTAAVGQRPKLKVAAYCRVSTDSEEQASSYEVQVAHYTQFIQKNPEWELAGIYADDGITGTNTKKREEFNRMIRDCMDGNIDMIITKSISRFARNTLDCLKYIRELKEKNIPVFFEKENINTMDSKGEVLLTIMARRIYGAGPDGKESDRPVYHGRHRSAGRPRPFPGTDHESPGQCRQVQPPRRPCLHHCPPRRP